MLLRRCDRCGRVRTLDKIMPVAIIFYKGEHESLDKTIKKRFYTDLCELCYQDFTRGWNKFLNQ